MAEMPAGGVISCCLREQYRTTRDSVLVCPDAEPCCWCPPCLQVVLEGPGRAPLVRLSADAAKRGPGTYDVPSLVPGGRTFDFSR